MIKYWYEVFKSDEKETYTLAICNTLKEARRIQKKTQKRYSDIYIDKWEDRESPKIIKSYK